MASVGIKTVGDVYAMDMEALEGHFGSYGQPLYELARGIDHSPVISNRVSKQISAEDAFPDDLPLAECEVHIRRLAEKVWAASHESTRGARTVVIKLKMKDFISFTRSLTPSSPPVSVQEFGELAVRLSERVNLEPQQL